MKLVLSMPEVLDIVRAWVRANHSKLEPGEITFVHKYGDGSGECDIETLGAIDRVEINV